jgi:uncharacterized protein (DUF4415 family)
MNNFSSSETSDNSDEYFNITQADLDRAIFRIGRNPNASKQSITISLDVDLIEYFKSRAGESGYQILINETLHQAKEREELSWENANN